MSRNSSLHNRSLSCLILAKVLVFCIAVLNDLEAWNVASSALRERFGMAQDEEFHGHEMNLKQVLELLEAAQAMGMRIGALLVHPPLDSPQARLPLNHHNIALSLLRQFLPLCALQKLWCDEDIKGKKAVQEFKTQVQRVNRAIYPNAKVDVRVRKSHTSSLIQLADVTAYALSREARNTLNHAALEEVLKKLRADQQNLIMGPVKWEDL